MIFAEMEYPEDYQDLHGELQVFLSANFSPVRSGLQGDSWFWVFDGDDMVAVDTFTSMKHQIKSGLPGPHVQKVIGVLSSKYKVTVYDIPIREGHDN